MRLPHKILAAVLASALFLCCAGTDVQATELSGSDTSVSVEWPTGPEISSETAILIEADTGTVLYEKNMHQQMYPASITKILTCLIAVEEGNLEDNVVFTQEALNTIPYDSSRIWVDVDEYLPLEDCIAAILIASANDVAAGVAEYIAGSIEAFADLMNERAEELGCVDSHFVNPHGYHDENHYTSAYDMAQIARAFFSVDLLCTYSSERTLHLYPSEGRDVETWESNKNQLLEGRTYEYEYLVGSKTGYTDMAGQTLVSCAQKDGMKLIYVVMNATSPQQYVDTIELFEFGFNNFTTVNIFENDTAYVSDLSSYDVEVTDILGNSTPLLSMDTEAFVVLPNGADFSDAASYITLATEEENCLATAHYLYGDHEIGSAQIYMEVSETATASAETPGELEVEQTAAEETADEDQTGETRVLFINIRNVIIAIAVLIVAALLLYFFRQPLQHGIQGRLHTLSLRTRYKKRRDYKETQPAMKKAKPSAAQKQSRRRHNPSPRRQKPDYPVSRYMDSRPRRRNVQMFDIHDNTEKK
ncbi:MAG: D-alanyl-D-alanine carboxypeptidase [Lachnospiraceae bacterium]|nr:D-alanyl-D-alanine carboxypeptidase [Lachnospiraceae bacterium]